MCSGAQITEFYFASFVSSALNEVILTRFLPRHERKYFAGRKSGNTANRARVSESHFVSSRECKQLRTALHKNQLSQDENISVNMAIPNPLTTLRQEFDSYPEFGRRLGQRMLKFRALCIRMLNPGMSRNIRLQFPFSLASKGGDSLLTQ